MKIEKISRYVALALAALILFLVVSSAASAATKNASLTINETQITTNLSNSEKPVIYDDIIVWQDDRNGVEDDENYDPNWDIYIGTICENEPTPIPPAAKFSAKPTSGKAPLTVAFTDKSTGLPTKWKWSSQ